MAAAAIFRRAVMCSISLRWYNRDKRAEECRGVGAGGLGGGAGEGVSLKWRRGEERGSNKRGE